MQCCNNGYNTKPEQNKTKLYRNFRHNKNRRLGPPSPAPPPPPPPRKKRKEKTIKAVTKSKQTATFKGKRVDSAAGFRSGWGGRGGGGGKRRRKRQWDWLFLQWKEEEERKRSALLSHFDGIGSKMTDLILIIIIITDRFYLALFSALGQTPWAFAACDS